MDRKFFRFLFCEMRGCFAHFGELRDTGTGDSFTFMYLRGTETSVGQSASEHTLFLCPEHLNLVVLGDLNGCTEREIKEILKGRLVDFLVCPAGADKVLADALANVSGKVKEWICLSPGKWGEADSLRNSFHMSAAGWHFSVWCGAVSGSSVEASLCEDKPGNGASVKYSSGGSLLLLHGPERQESAIAGTAEREGATAGAADQERAVAGVAECESAAVGAAKQERAVVGAAEQERAVAGVAECESAAVGAAKQERAVVGTAEQESAAVGETEQAGTAVGANEGGFAVIRQDDRGESPFDDCVMNVKVMNGKTRCVLEQTPDEYGCVFGCILCRDYDACNYRESRASVPYLTSILLFPAAEFLEPEKLLVCKLAKAISNVRFFAVSDWSWRLLSETVFSGNKKKGLEGLPSWEESPLYIEETGTPENFKETGLTKDRTGEHKRYFIGLEQDLKDESVSAICRSSLSVLPVVLTDGQGICCSGFLKYREV